MSVTASCLNMFLIFINHPFVARKKKDLWNVSFSQIRFLINNDVVRNIYRAWYFDIGSLSYALFLHSADAIFHDIYVIKLLRYTLRDVLHKEYRESFFETRQFSYCLFFSLLRWRFNISLIVSLDVAKSSTVARTWSLRNGFFDILKMKGGERNEGVLHTVALLCLGKFI